MRYLVPRMSFCDAFSCLATCRTEGCLNRVHGSFLVRRHRGHPGVVLPLVISDSANHEEGMQVE